MSILDFKSDTDILFDPGYSASVARVSGNIEYMYSAFSAIPSLKQKKFQFSIIYPKFLKAINLNAAFYLGCMLWGVYLKSLEDKNIVNNPCLGADFDDEAFYEIDFLLDFVKTGLNRDVKYYLNKTYSANPLHIEILEIYREFLEENKGFVDVKKTSDIKIPKSLKTPNDNDLKEIHNTILEAVQNDDLEILFKVSDKIL